MENQSSDASLPLQPTPPPAIADSLDRPSRWLRSGFVLYSLGDVTAWINVQAHLPIGPADESSEPAAVEALFKYESTRKLLTRFAVTFAKFLPITAWQWEADLRQSPCPETLLRLWETVLQVFDHYTHGKKFPLGATTDYYWIVLDFCNGVPEAWWQKRRLLSLKPSRVERVVEDMGRYFSRLR